MKSTALGLAIMVLSVLIIQFASAATLSGSIYDLELESVNSVLIEIDTTPVQRVVAQNGTYTLELPKGRYTLTARQADKDLLVQIPVIIEKEGSFVLDIVMLPSLEDIELLGDFDALELDVDEPKPTWPYVIVAIALVGIIAIRALKRKTPKVKSETSEVKKDAAKVLDIINNEGRITQRELRAKLPEMSEAKVSLIVAELEHEKKVKKIKKGRGNVIIAQ